MVQGHSQGEGYLYLLIFGLSNGIPLGALKPWAQFISTWLLQDVSMSISPQVNVCVMEKWREVCVWEGGYDSLTFTSFCHLYLFDAL